MTIGAQLNEDIVRWHPEADAPFGSLGERFVRVGGTLLAGIADNHRDNLSSALALFLDHTDHPYTRRQFAALMGLSIFCAGSCQLSLARGLRAVRVYVAVSRCAASAQRKRSTRRISHCRSSSPQCFLWPASLTPRTAQVSRSCLGGRASSLTLLGVCSRPFGRSCRHRRRQCGSRGRSKNMKTEGEDSGGLSATLINNLAAFYHQIQPGE